MSTRATPNAMRTTKTQTGDAGEAVAVAYLETAGYTIVDRNWHSRAGEIDIIARAPSGVIAFVEVRTRHAGLEEAFASIRPTKQRRMIDAASLYVAQHLPDAVWRIDVIAVVLPARGRTLEIAHAEDAIGWSGA